MEMNKSQLLEQGFSPDQIEEIKLGIKAGVDVSVYADRRYLAIQMQQIRYGLEAGLDVRYYANPEYDWFQMKEIRKGLLTGLPIEKYASLSISYDRMKQIRLGLCDDVDMSPFKHLKAGVLKQLRLALKNKVRIVSYINEGYDARQLEAIREALEKNIPIEPYLNKSFLGVAIQEISLGLEHGVDVTCYVNPRYGWRQMREIRLGLEHLVDVSHYANRYYTHEQMREIRLGLEEGLDVSYYKSLMYTASDMEKRRRNLLEHPGLAASEKKDNEADTQEEIVQITLENENTEAYITICGETENVHRSEVLTAIRKKEITTGIQYDTIDLVLEGKEKKEHTLIGLGLMPVHGKDGYYDYFFRTHVPRTPQQTEDGAVDFRSVQWYEQVSKGQKIAVYHGATDGRNGITVTGKVIPARKGKEKCILTGIGFHRLPDKVTYVSDLDGVIFYSEKQDESGNLVEIHIEITKLLVVDEVTLATGDVSFDGNVYVKGNVGSGASVSATGDILIGGFVESSVVEAGGSIMIQQGMNASGEGKVQAGEDVNGFFFEAVKIRAGGDICGDYFLNCDLYAKKKIRAMGKKGSLAGGMATAERGLEVQHLGNQAGISTDIKLGIGERIKKEEIRINDKIKAVKKELDIFMRAHQDFLNRYQLQACNTNGLFLKIESAIYTKELEMTELLQRLKRLNDKKKEAMIVSAVISGTLYENVSLEIDGTKWKSTKTIGSVRVKKIKDSIALLPNR